MTNDSCIQTHRLKSYRSRAFPSWRSVGVVGSALIAFSTGCMDGPMFAIKRANPYYRAQWKEDEEKGFVFRQREDEIRKLRSQFPSMDVEEQGQWVAELAKVYDYETSPALRFDSITALGKSTHPDVDAVLVRACSDESTKVRIAACKSLAGRQSITASQMLATVAQSDKDTSVRSAALRSLGTFQTDDAKSILRKSLDEKSPAIQFAATEALKAMIGKDLGGDVDTWRQFLDGEPIEEAPANMVERIGSVIGI